MTTEAEQPHIVRCRISHEMAFPVGYELLWEHFGKLFHWPEARFYFCNHPTTFASDFAAILRAQTPYRVLRVSRERESFIPRHVPGHWHFTIFPVRRELKCIARTTLVSQCFAELQNFVVSAPTHANYYNCCDAIFDPVEGACKVTQWRETLASPSRPHEPRAEKSAPGILDEDDANGD